MSLGTSILSGDNPVVIQPQGPQPTKGNPSEPHVPGSDSTPGNVETVKGPKNPDAAPEPKKT